MRTTKFIKHQNKSYTLSYYIFSTAWSQIFSIQFKMVCYTYKNQYFIYKSYYYFIFFFFSWPQCIYNIGLGGRGTLRFLTARIKSINSEHRRSQHHYLIVLQFWNHVNTRNSEYSKTILDDLNLHKVRKLTFEIHKSLN